MFDEQRYLIQALSPYRTEEAVLIGEAGWHTFLESHISIPLGVVNAFRDMIIAPTRLYVQKLEVRALRLRASATANAEEVSIAELETEAAHMSLKAHMYFYYQMVAKYKSENPRTTTSFEWF